MGVNGLWRLIEPSGKPVPLETLENKILAVDVSIWLHQLVKGFQDSKGASVPNAHLLGLYHRLCKLLYFRIKPVFVFDGSAPVLKKQTIAKRHQAKARVLNEANRIHKDLLSTLLKHSAISKVLSEKAKAEITASTSPTKKSKKGQSDELYVLPSSTSFDKSESSSFEEYENSSSSAEDKVQYDLHSIDTNSAHFKALPPEIRHEILTDLKETRKQSSWGRIHELPSQSDGFSMYQMNRLLKRQSVQMALEDVEKEMGGHSLSLGELEEILKDQGVISRNSNVKGSRIASNENTRFLLIKDIKQALEKAKEEQANYESLNNKVDLELQEDLKKAIALSLENEPSVSKQENENNKNKTPLSFLQDYRVESSEEEIFQSNFFSVQQYMKEYTNLTTNEINSIIMHQNVEKKNNSESISPYDSENVESIETTAVNTTNNETEESHDKNTPNRFTEITSTVNNKSTDCLDDVRISLSQRDSSKMIETDEKEIEANEISSNIIEKARTISHSESDDGGFLAKTLQDDKIQKIISNDITETKQQETTFIQWSSKIGEQIEVTSESEPDDFLEVENSQEENTGKIMQVIINPDEEIEDDLFRDIFATAVASESGKYNASDTNHPTDKSKKLKTQSITEDVEEIVQKYSNSNGYENSLVSSELTMEQLDEIRGNLNKEKGELIKERSNKERLVGNITEQINKEAQELLELFGVPYLVAPMEAEAQCAFLEMINLTDGTITDDSDIWLFGGRTVYKNFFNQSKTVLEFKYDNIQQHYKLTREQMILLAMLVGSDYTVGLNGVGPVTALEILAAFPPKSNQLVSGLVEFKAWFTKGKVPASHRTSLRNKLKKCSFNENFPNIQIAQAYLEPQVDTSREKFSWGKPDTVGLVDFAKQKFGWTNMKTEEMLNPVLKKLQDQGKQKMILDYFKREFKPDSNETEKKMSKRVKCAVKKIAINSMEGTVDNDQEGTNPRKQRKTRKRKGDQEISVLDETVEKSRKKIQEIEINISQEIEKQKDTLTVNFVPLHKEEVIPQRQKDKNDLLKNKLKAIETFRKSKHGPGYIKKKGKIIKISKNDASYLSSDSD